MGLLVPIALFCWPFAVLAMFSLLPSRKAVLTAYIGAWLFLPMAAYDIPGFPDYTKVLATTVGVAAATLIFDVSRFLRFRPHWLDLPMAVFCLWPMASSLAMGHGAYDGVSAIVEQTIVWGLPYFFGRIYFTDLAAFRELTVAIVIGGLIYVPLCLFEIRMSPQLHNWIYGYHQHNFAQTMRFGGFRPMVFMQHGLAVGMWMSNATLLAIWLWRTKAVRRLGLIPISWLIPVLLVTTILVKSLGALMLMVLGLVTIFTAKWMKGPWPLLALLAVPPVWMIARTFGFIDGQLVYDLVYPISPDRAQSFQVRLDQEETMRELALRHPIVGGSRWWDFGNDQMWLLMFRNFGAVGLSAVTLVLLFPTSVMLWRIRFRRLVQSKYSPLVGLSLIVVLYMLDNLANAMINPIFILASGAIASAAAEACRKGLEDNMSFCGTKFLVAWRPGKKDGVNGTYFAPFP